MKTQDSLEVVWNGEEGQEFCGGIYLCGWFPSGLTGKWSEQIRRVCGAIGGDCQVRDIEQHGTVRIVTVRLTRFPNDIAWRKAVEDALTTLLNQGAAVAWAGGEDCSWYLEVLAPDSEAGNVYAAKSADTGFLCNSNLTEDIKFLAEDQLQALWRVVQQNRQC